MHLLPFSIDGAAMIFPTSYAATGNQTIISSVEPLLRDLKAGRFSGCATMAAAISQQLPMQIIVVSILFSNVLTPS